MTRTQFLTQVEKVLRKRRDALRRTVSNELSHLNAESDRTGGDLGDAAVVTGCGTVSSNLAEFESRELSRIEHALDRIREGTYGTCEECGKSIPVARLRALPYASLCVKCQEKADSAARRPDANGYNRLAELSDAWSVGFVDSDLAVTA